jgi:hypothetical protein
VRFDRLDGCVTPSTLNGQDRAKEAFGFLEGVLRDLPVPHFHSRRF